ELDWPVKERLGSAKIAGDCSDASLRQAPAGCLPDMTRGRHGTRALVRERRKEGGGPQIGGPFGSLPIISLPQSRIRRLLSVDFVGAGLGQIGDGGERAGDAVDAVLDVVAKQSLGVGAVVLLNFTSDRFVIASDRLVGIVRNAGAQNIEIEHADEAVAAFYMMIQ